jgi:hypothetical protein
MGQRRSPRVQHGGDADSRAEVPGIGGDGQHRVRSRAEEEVIDHRLVLEGDVSNLGRHGEHDVEVSHRQQIGLARGQPGARGGALALGTMPVAAGVVGDPPVPAVVAGLDVTAQRGGAAVLDGRHDLELAKAQMPGLGCAIRGPGAAEDVSDLERGAHRLSREAMPFAAGLPSRPRSGRADWPPPAWSCSRPGCRCRSC